MRKVMKVKTGVFLKTLRSDGIEVTDHIRFALDISDWSFEQVEYVTHNLYNVGYREMKVLEVV